MPPSGRELQSPCGAIFLRQFFTQVAMPETVMGCNPLAGLFFCDADVWYDRVVQIPVVAIPLRGYFFATTRGSLRCCGGIEVCCNPLAGLFFCDTPSWTVRNGIRLLLLQTPCGAIFLRLNQVREDSKIIWDGCNPLAGLFFCDLYTIPDVIDVDNWLQSPCGAIFLRHLWFWDYRFQLRRPLQSPCGAIFLRQHTPLSAVLYRALKGGIYENCQLFTDCLWITLQKVRFIAMEAHKAALLNFLWWCDAISIAQTCCQEARRKPPT